MATSESKLSMKLLIDSKAGKVLFAEAEKNCVDFLFHILSLPVGSVIRLLKEEGMNGCLPNLYESVENLNETYIQSTQGKDILLKPKSAVGISSVPLLLQNDAPSAQRTFYGCQRGCTSYIADYPSAPQTRCPSCNSHNMSRELTYLPDPKEVNNVGEAKGGFVKEVVTYMVMDDLVVKPMSTISSITLLNKFNVTDVGVLQEEIVNFGMDEALKLLKASFESKAVLTSVFINRIKVSK